MSEVIITAQGEVLVTSPAGVPLSDYEELNAKTQQNSQVLTTIAPKVEANTERLENVELLLSSPPVDLDNYGAPVYLTNYSKALSSVSSYDDLGDMISMPAGGRFYVLNSSSTFQNGKGMVQSQKEGVLFALTMRVVSGNTDTHLIRFRINGTNTAWEELKRAGQWIYYDGVWPIGADNFDIDVPNSSDDILVLDDLKYYFAKNDNPYVDVDAFKQNYSPSVVAGSDSLILNLPSTNEALNADTARTLSYQNTLTSYGDEVFWAIKLSDEIYRCWVVNQGDTSPTVRIGLEYLGDGWYMGRNIIGDGRQSDYGNTVALQLYLDNNSRSSFTARDVVVEHIICFDQGKAPSLQSLSGLVGQVREAIIYPLENVIVSDLPDGNKRIIASTLNDGNLYYSLGRGLWVSRDNGFTITQIMDTQANDEQGAPRKIIPAGDGEVLLACGQDGVLKSTNWTGDPNADLLNTVTWTKTTDATGVSEVHAWGIDSDGKGNVVATQYSASTFSDSNDVLLSVDSGATWTVIHSINNVNHMHYVVIDRYATHLPDGTIRIGFSYHSSTTPDPDEPTRRVVFGDYDTSQTATQNANAWVDIPNEENSVNERNPTVCIVTPKGYIIGSDRGVASIWRVARERDINNMVIRLLTPSNHVDFSPTHFAVYGQWYHEYGVGVMTFISQINGNDAVIFATDGEIASEVFRSELPENNGSGYREFAVDRLGNIHVYNPIVRNGQAIRRHVKARLPEISR